MAFIKISGLPRYQRLPEPLQGELQAPTPLAPSPELAPSGVELLGLGAEKGKRGKGRFLCVFFFFCRHALAGGYFHGQFQHSPRDPAFITKFCWGKP